jgi:hypothetical protein
VDIVPTVLSHLGIEPAEEWGLDGRVVGFEATAPPEALLDVNLLLNGDAELERGYTDFWPDAAVPGWTDEGYATVMIYGAPSGFPLDTDPGPAERGDNFFCGGGTTDDTHLAQTVSLAALSDELAGGVGYTLSAYVGGYSSQDDRSQVTVTFSDRDEVALHSATVGPLFAEDREDVTGLWERSVSGSVPSSAASATVTLTAIRSSGYNDGYADNLSLVISVP